MKRKIGLLLLFGSALLAACNLQPAGGTPASPPPTPTSQILSILSATATDEPCIPSGSQMEINAALSGPGSEAVLCPGAVFALTAPVRFSAADQKIYTQGLPTDDRRATLRLASPTVTTAVLMRDFDDVLLANVIVNGDRPTLGPRSGDALIFAGGASSGQTVRFVKAMEPRSWSALHLIEGSSSQPCRNALIEYNEIGPSGTSDNAWADGISLACTNTTVRNNVIVDATDGGIVVFGAPGSLIESNTIRAETRILLGGINLVDYAPYAGNYTGTIVRDNLIDAHGAVIRIGLGMGVFVWGCQPDETKTLSGATVTGNALRGERMQYGFAVDGVRDWTVTGNVDAAVHSGVPSQNCAGVVASPPAGFQFNPLRAQGTFQPEFQAARLDLALWAILAPQP
jgi:parallel beta-helix repeat protein